MNALRFTLRAMACDWGVEILGEPDAYAEQAASAAFAEVERLERVLSRFVPSSDVSRISAATPGEAVRVGIEAFECLELAERVWRESDGAFDVTYASAQAVDANAAGGDAGAAPAEAGHPRLRLDRATLSVSVRAPGTTVDLGALGKGFALDAAAQVLTDWGVGGARLHCGGSTVVSLGDGPSGAAWEVDLRDPFDATRSVARCRPGALALSGSANAARSHIVDPRGRPIDERRAVWALAPSAVLADALSTAFLLLRDDALAAWCERDTRCGAIVARHDGGWTVTHFGAAAGMLVDA